jgi:hypothetical protein
MRVHKHYCPVPGKGQLRLVGTCPVASAKSRVKRRIAESYYAWLRWRCGHEFVHPRGLLVVHNLGMPADILTDGNIPDGIFEVVCHPAANSKGLSETEFNRRRLSEFELLRSPELVCVLSKSKISGRIVTFSSLKHV